MEYVIGMVIFVGFVFLARRFMKKDDAPTSTTTPPSTGSGGTTIRSVKTKSKSNTNQE